MANDQDPLEAAPDPTEDTPETEPEETAEDEAEGPIDWEARYKEQQKVLSRQGAELGLLRRGEADESEEDADAEDDEDDAEPTGDGAPDPYLARLESQSWELVRDRFGDQAISAYEAFYRVYARAETPADYMAALEAYVEVRSGKPAAADVTEKAPAKDRSEALKPRVDSNRSDNRGPDSDDALAEARKSGKLGDFTKAAAAAMGFGPERS